MQQRWNKPLNHEPGHWKKQLPTKYSALAVKGDVPGLQALLRQHPEYLDKRAGHGRTLLWEAVRKNKPAAVRFLLAAGANVNIAGAYNSESHVQITPYCAARYYKCPVIAEMLKAHGAVENIFQAAFLGEQDIVAAFLATDPNHTLINAEDDDDEIWYHTPLAFAVAGGQLLLAEWLIRQGAEVPSYSSQLLWLAAKQDRRDLIDVLLATGAEIKAIESGVYLSLTDLSLMRYLLEQGAPVNGADAHGNVPIVFLARGDKRANRAKLQLLLDFGADINAAAPNGKTALAYARDVQHSDLIDWLTQHGARA